MKHLVLDDGSLHSMTDFAYDNTLNAKSMNMFRDYVRDITLEVGQKWFVNLTPFNDFANLDKITIVQLSEKVISFERNGVCFATSREIGSVKFVEKVRI